MIKRSNLKSRFFIINLLFSVVFLISCEKEEAPVSPRERGDVLENSVDMETDYRYQFFFDLETNSIVGQNLKTDWDLGFEASPEGTRVVINTANFMSVKKSGSTDFSVNFPNEFDADIHSDEIDSPNGDLDSTAIGNWVGNEEVYLIHRGYSPSGMDLGAKKIVFQSVDENEYIVKFADLDGSNEVEMAILKDDNYNFTFLSFNDGGKLVDIQPPKDDWDIAFTRHTEILPNGEDILVYGVTSILSNRYLVEVARDFESDFLDIDINKIDDYYFSDAINAIGHEWKYFDFDEGFVIFYENNYIIKSTEGKYFKLHFIDFYDENGIKGTPAFEFQEL